MLAFLNIGLFCRVSSLRFWTLLRQLWSDVYACRVVISSILIIFYLLHSGQGEELTSSLVLVPSSGSWLLFISIAAWAAQCWLWSRVAIALNKTDKKDAEANLLDEVLPLALATAVFLIALEPFVRAEKTGVISLIGISCFCLFVGAATWVLQPSRTDPRLDPPQPLTAPALWPLAFILDIRIEDRTRFAKWRSSIATSFVWSLCGLILGAVFTLQLGKILGTLGTVFWASSILMPFAAAAAISARRTNFPVLWAVLLAPFLLPTIYDRLLHAKWAAGIAGAALIIVAGLYFVRSRPFAALFVLTIGGSLVFLSYHGSHLRLNVPHEVTTLKPARSIKRCENAKDAGCVSSLAAEIDTWLSTASAVQPKQKNFVVFVAAAGGGLRAGYWTASVLARLTDCIPNFRERLFAISGVSGGSLGAGLYAALVQNSQRNAGEHQAHCPDHPLTISDPAAVKSPMQSQLTDFLEKDFLAPVAASLFFRDLPQALFPIQLIPDRAAILERAFDQAWSDACSTRPSDAACRNSDQFGRSFFDSRSADRWTPVLFFNGTHEETGKRVITSQMRIDQETFFDAFDFFDLVGRDISLSTAIMNSARFPVVSPAGALIKSDQELAVGLNGHVIDGGFFENNGATTLQEVMEATLGYLRLKRPFEQWRPLVIEIVNDVEAQEADLARNKNEIFPKPLDQPLELSSKPYEETEIANQLFSSVTGLYATRTARGILASKMLADTAVRKNNNDGEFVQFRLCPHMRPSPPLGWLLTGQSRRSMDQLILGLGRSDYQQLYAGYLDGNALAQFKNCFDDVQQSFISVQKFLAQ
jgi:hypothetical protein